MQNIVGEVKSLGIARHGNGVLIPRRRNPRCAVAVNLTATCAVNDIPLDDDVRERRILRFLSGIELDGRPVIAPDPMGMAVAEVGDDVVG